MSEKLGEVDLAAVAALIGDRARAAMLTALADGRALPAGELARRAGVTPATATTHLQKLVDGGLLRVFAQGRHRYHQLAGPQVAAALEALAPLAPTQVVTNLRQHREVSALAEARTCYDHLAGRRGVELRERLLAAGALHTIGDRDHELTNRGHTLMTALGIDSDELRCGRRIFARSCLDFTERRPHLAGALPAAVTATFLDRGWLERSSRRGLRVAADYDERLDRWLTGASAPTAETGPISPQPLTSSLRHAVATAAHGV